MPEHHETHVRCLVATVAAGRASLPDDVTAVVAEELRSGGVNVVRVVTVNREKEYLMQLVRNVVTANETDVVVLVGGAGIGPRDFACEAVDELADRAIEGFGEEYRALLRADEDSFVTSVLTRAAAAVYDGCIVLALPRQKPPVMRRAIQTLVLPILPRALKAAQGHGHI